MGYWEDIQWGAFKSHPVVNILVVIFKKCYCIIFLNSDQDGMLGEKIPIIKVKWWTEKLIQEVFPSGPGITIILLKCIFYCLGWICVCCSSFLCFCELSVICW